MSSAWSATLIEQTRAILDLQCDPFSDFVHMKNFKGGYGKISLKDLLARKFVIQDKNTNATHIYASADELIAAGWAID